MHRASSRIIEAVINTSKKLRRYVLVLSFTCLLTGVLTSLWCFLVGVDLAFVWGLIPFLLNYIPTLGSIIAVIPPTLAALLYQGVWQGVAALVGLAAIQVLVGNFVDPRLQGRTLQLSPFIALILIVFWGWVWGIPSALLGIPMTVFIILLSQEFETTRGIALLLGEPQNQDEFE
jgi:AI-2 transport protein TqsA